MGKSVKKRLAVIAYTTLSTDSRVLKECYAALEAGFEVDIYTLEHPGNKDYQEFNIISSGFKQYKGSNKKKFIKAYFSFFFFVFFSLTKNFFKKKYNVIHFNNMPNFLVFSALIPKLIGAKVILDIHDLMPEIFSAKFNLPRNNILIKMFYFEERISGYFANELIATNKFHADRFRRNGLANKKITEVINVADDKVYYPPENKSYEDDTLIIVYPTTLAKRLGIDVLIEAMYILKMQNIKMQLRIYGDGEYKDELHKILNARNLNDYIWLSDSFVSMKELSAEMDRSHIGVVPYPDDPSTNMNMPVKVNEYFAKKLCVVTSELILLKDYFQDQIVFFKAGDADSLSKKLIWLYNDREALKDFAEKGYKLFSEKNWDYYKKKYQEVLLSK